MEIFDGVFWSNTCFIYAQYHCTALTGKPAMTLSFQVFTSVFESAYKQPRSYVATLIPVSFLLNALSYRSSFKLLVSTSESAYLGLSHDSSIQKTSMKINWWLEWKGQVGYFGSNERLLVLNKPGIDILAGGVHLRAVCQSTRVLLLDELGDLFGIIMSSLKIVSEPVRFLNKSNFEPW